MHNTVIMSIKKDGIELMPVDQPGIHPGYDDPRTYLPADMVALLDRELPPPEASPSA
jgi:hypothetical protein